MHVKQLCNFPAAAAAATDADAVAAGERKNGTTRILHEKN